MAESKTTKKTTTKKSAGLSADVFDVKGTAQGSVELAKDIFDASASRMLLAQYVRVYLANQRQGTHSTKGRGDVQASTRKIYRQKGTGRARHGARTANLFVGGGVTFGPQVRSHNLRLNKKQRQKALYYALSLKAQDGKVKVLSGVDSASGKTKEMADALSSHNLEARKTLVVYAPEQASIARKSFGNIKGISTAQDRLVNAFNVLKAENVVFTQEALNDFLTFRKAA